MKLGAIRMEMGIVHARQAAALAEMTDEATTDERYEELMEQFKRDQSRALELCLETLAGPLQRLG